jgi:hypothetical protein
MRIPDKQHRDFASLRRWGRREDAAASLRYLVATKSRTVRQRKLRGL